MTSSEAVGDNLHRGTGLSQHRLTRSSWRRTWCSNEANKYGWMIVKANQPPLAVAARRRRPTGLVTHTSHRVLWLLGLLSVSLGGSTELSFEKTVQLKYNLACFLIPFHSFGVTTLVTTPQGLVLRLPALWERGPSMWPRKSGAKLLSTTAHQLPTKC